MFLPWLFLHRLSHVVKEVVHLKFISILVCAGFAQALSAASRDGDSCVLALAVAAFVEHRLLSARA